MRPFSLSERQRWRTGTENTVKVGTISREIRRRLWQRFFLTCARSCPWCHAPHWGSTPITLNSQSPFTGTWPGASSRVFPKCGNNTYEQPTERYLTILPISFGVAAALCILVLAFLKPFVPGALAFLARHPPHDLCDHGLDSCLLRGTRPRAALLLIWSSSVTWSRWRRRPCCGEREGHRRRACR